MNAFLGWAAIAATVAFLVPEGYRVIIAVTSTLGFWACVGTYFYLDYRGVHKKPKLEIKFPPLSTETVETPKIVTKVRSKKTIVGAVLIVIVEIFEAVLFISLIVTWRTFTINNVPVLTYENAILIGFFSLGLFLATDVIRRFRSKKAFFGDE
jgi:hypothetical protein